MSTWKCGIRLRECSHFVIGLLDSSICMFDMSFFLLLKNIFWDKKNDMKSNETREMCIGGSVGTEAGSQTVPPAPLAAARAAAHGERQPPITARLW